jgi:hypothetical protein
MSLIIKKISNKFYSLRFLTCNCKLIFDKLAAFILLNKYIIKLKISFKSKVYHRIFSFNSIFKLSICNFNWVFVNVKDFVSKTWLSFLKNI